jgi:hypothetical protein
VLNSPPYAAVLKAQAQAEEYCRQAEEKIESVDPKLEEITASFNEQLEKCAKTKEVDTQLSGKVNLPPIGGYTRIPVVKPESAGGGQGYHSLTASNVRGTVMLRDSETGRSKINTPAESDDIANKGYVDSRETFILERMSAKDDELSNAFASRIEMAEQTLNGNIEDTKRELSANIDEVESIAKGATQAESFFDYEEMVEKLNVAPRDTYRIGQSLFINTRNVPDLWIYNKGISSTTYNYSTDEVFVNELKSKGYVKVGYFTLSALETQKVDLTEYVKNTDYATTTKHGLVKVPYGNSGLMVSSGILRIDGALNSDIDAKKDMYRPIVPANLNYAVKSVTYDKKEIDQKVASIKPDNIYANVLKGNESGEIVSMDDVSPIPHKVKAKTSSKNLLSVNPNGSTQDVTLTAVDSNSFTVEANGITWAAQYSFWESTLKAGTYTLSFNITTENDITAGRPNELYIWFDNDVKNLTAMGTDLAEATQAITFTVSKDDTLVKLAYYVNVSGEIEYNNFKATLTNIQLEKSVVATPFTPYVPNDTQITVTSRSKNYFDISKVDSSLAGNDIEIVGNSIIFKGYGLHFCRLKNVAPELIVGKTYTLNAETTGSTVQGETNLKFIYVATPTKSFQWSFGAPLTMTEDILAPNTSLLLYGSQTPEGERLSTTIRNIQIEEGTVATGYEPYAVHESVITTIAEGAELNSVAPNMTITTDTQGVIIDAEYNKDTNKVIEKLTQAIISLGGNI